MSQTKTIAVDDKIVDLIEETMRGRLQGVGLRSVSVRAKEDHAGTPALFIEVEYDLTDAPVDIAVTSRLTTIVSDKLWEAGETRFPYIRHNFPDAQQFKKRRRAGA